LSIHHLPHGTLFSTSTVASLLSVLPPKVTLLGPLHELLRRHSVHCLNEESVCPAFLGGFGCVFRPILQSTLTLCSIALHWISKHECVLQNVKMAMNFTGVRIYRVVPAVNVLIEESKKLANAPVEHLWLASCVQWQVLGAVQMCVKTQSQLHELDMSFHVAKNRRRASRPLRVWFDAATFFHHFAFYETGKRERGCDGSALVVKKTEEKGFGAGNWVSVPCS
jgi:hypothetical protein